MAATQINWHQVASFRGESKGDTKVRVEAYNNAADIYDEDMKKLNYHQCPILAAKTIHKALKGNTDARILDVACGTGLFVSELRKLAAYDNIDGLDASRNMLDVALKQGLYKNGLCQYFDVDSDIQAGSYDAVVSLAAFVPEHLPARAVKEMCRLARPGGYAMILMRASYLDVDEDLSKLRVYVREMVDAGQIKVVEDREFDNHWAGHKGQIILLHKL